MSNRELNEIGASSESGSVLMIFAMLIFSILIFASLAIDFSQRAVTEQQADSFAKFTALAALQGYAFSDRTLSEDDRLAAALVPAGDSQNQNKFLNNYNRSASLLTSVERDIPDRTALAAGPKLVAGRYYFESPFGCANPCAGSDAVPCFVPLAKISTQSACRGSRENVPNAFRVMGKYLSDAKTIFAQVFSSGIYSVEVDEIAMFAPRRGVMLVDVSDSMFRGTHSTRLSTPSFYAHRLSNNNSNIPNTAQRATFDALDDNRPPVPDDEPGSSYDQHHYASDYIEVSPLADSDFNSDYANHHPSPTFVGAAGDHRAARLGNHYLVDEYRDRFYEGPQPFNTVLVGLNAAVNAFEERAVTGDKLAIVFFDKEITWPRVIKLTSDFEYIKRFTDPSAFHLRHLHQMFPGVDSFSNITLALNEALTLFSLDSGEENPNINNLRLDKSIPSVDFITYFGDGLANCVSDQFIDWARAGQSQGCKNSFAYYHEAMENPTKGLKAIARNVLFNHKIPFHAVLTGGHVRPHSLLWNDGQSGSSCMTDTQARSARPNPIPFVKGTLLAPRGNPYQTQDAAYRAMSDSTPFFQANEDMYYLTRVTGGVWAPLRSREANCGTRDTDPDFSCTAEYSPSQTPVLYDATCRDDEKVIVEYIKDIMGANPYMIVPKD